MPMLRQTLKRIFYTLALLCASPLVLGERLARWLCRRDVWFATHAQALSLLPGRTGYLVRNAYYHLTLRRCPLNCCFVFGMVFTHSEAEVGRGVYIGAHSMIGLATIGDGTMIADHVHVLSGKHQHGTDPGLRFQDQPQVFTRILIGENSWLGTNTVVMAGIGKNCVIGAGSVVTKPIPDDSVAVGNPARVIRARKGSERKAAIHSDLQEQFGQEENEVEARASK